jgi:hypothetical protein
MNLAIRKTGSRRGDGVTINSAHRKRGARFVRAPPPGEGAERQTAEGQ